MHERGVTALASRSRRESAGVTPPSSLILAHAPDRQPPVGFGFPGPSGLCRLLRAPAGRRPFPTLSLRSLHGCLGPYPVAIKRCISPLLPARHRPLLRVKKIGLRTLFRNAALCGGSSRGCNHSVMFRLPCLLGPQAAPTMRALCPSRRRAVYTGQDLRRYRSQAPASLRVRTGQLTRQDLRGLTPARTCWIAALSAAPDPGSPAASPAIERKQCHSTGAQCCRRPRPRARFYQKRELVKALAYRGGRELFLQKIVRTT